MIAQKFTESIADVMRYIVNAEMGGLIDPKHHLYPTYLDLRDMFVQVKSKNEALDLQSHAVLPAFQPQEPKLAKLNLPDIDHPDTKEKWEGKQYDTDLDVGLWTN